ncbi:hypothetical protein BKA62DRAFT_700224 [Auriculariales sp. MPI-PUGE-AT-0066]|nr:hypothetical protein BKA62DRAFT_700224 [Auriculariales sp. MPI-PUGE-AT-0066]
MSRAISPPSSVVIHCSGYDDQLDDLLLLYPGLLSSVVELCVAIQVNEANGGPPSSTRAGKSLALIIQCSPNLQRLVLRLPRSSSPVAVYEMLVYLMRYSRTEALPSPRIVAITWAGTNQTALSELRGIHQSVNRIFPSAEVLSLPLCDSGRDTASGHSLRSEITTPGSLTHNPRDTLSIDTHGSLNPGGGSLSWIQTALATRCFTNLIVKLDANPGMDPSVEFVSMLSKHAKHLQRLALVSSHSWKPLAQNVFAGRLVEGCKRLRVLALNWTTFRADLSHRALPTLRSSLLLGLSRNPVEPLKNARSDGDDLLRRLPKSVALRVLQLQVHMQDVSPDQTRDVEFEAFRGQIEGVLESFSCLRQLRAIRVCFMVNRWRNYEWMAKYQEGFRVSMLQLCHQRRIALETRVGRAVHGISFL